MLASDAEGDAHTASPGERQPIKLGSCARAKDGDKPQEQAGDAEAEHHLQNGYDNPEFFHGQAFVRPEGQLSVRYGRYAGAPATPTGFIGSPVATVNCGAKNSMPLSASARCSAA